MFVFLSWKCRGLDWDTPTVHLVFLFSYKVVFIRFRLQVFVDSVKIISILVLYIL